MIPFNIPPLLGKERSYLGKVLTKRKLSGDGEFTKKCNKWLEKKFSCKKALLTTSCSHALDMAALIIDIQPGDEVIMPSYTFVSTANAFALRGAKIVFVDIRPDTMNIDENLIENAISKRTKVIVVVHYAGVACEMDKILAIARKYGLFIVEDAAQGVMSKYKSRYLGTLGDIGCYSFHETKNYTSGEGGAIILNKAKYIEKAEIIREKGTDRSKFNRGQVDKYSWVGLGSSYLPSELNAAYLYSQLEVAEQIKRKRRAIWKFYYKKLKKLQNAGYIELPNVPENCHHNGHMFYIKVKSIKERTNLINYLSSKGIMSVFHYVPLHSSKAGIKYGRFQGKDIFTTKESDRLIRLPMYYDLTRKKVEKVVGNIYTFFGKPKPTKKRNYWKKHWLRDICWLLGFLVLFFIVSRAFFSFRWTDDYCTLNVIRDKNIWQYAWYAYNNWDGRGIMTGLISGSAIKYLPVTITNSIWALALIGTAFVVNKILQFELIYISRDKYDSLIRTAAIAGTLWLGMGIHISETIYWATGGFYIFSAFLGVLWSYYLLKLVNNIRSKPHPTNQEMIVFFLLSIPTGMLSHNLSTGLLVFGVTIMIIYWLNNQYDLKKLLTGIFALVGIIVGTIIISVAPGNFIRAAAAKRSFQLNIPTLMQNYLDALKFYLGISQSLIILCILAAFLLTFLLGKKFGLKEAFTINLGRIGKEIKIPLNKKILIKILDRSKYLLASFATVLPFVLLPDFATPRTSIYFMIFLSIFIFVSFIPILKPTLFVPGNKSTNQRKGALTFGYLMLCLLFLFQLSILVPHNIQTYKIQKEINKREKILAGVKNTNADIVLPLLNIGVVPFSARFSDVSEDSKFWINNCISQYYGLKSVRTRGFYEPK